MTSCVVSYTLGIQPPNESNQFLKIFKTPESGLSTLFVYLLGQTMSVIISKSASIMDRLQGSIFCFIDIATFILRSEWNPDPDFVQLLNLTCQEFECDGKIANYSVEFIIHYQKSVTFRSFTLWTTKTSRQAHQYSLHFGGICNKMFCNSYSHSRLYISVSAAVSGVPAVVNLLWLEFILCVDSFGAGTL